MKKILGFLFVLLTLISCVPRIHTHTVAENGHLVKVLPIYLDARWSADEVAAIERGIGDWNEALNGQMRLDVIDWHYQISDDDPGLQIIKMSARNKRAREDDALVSLGWTNWTRTRIYLITDRLIVRDGEKDIETAWTLQDVREITTHELGHALGADHVRYDGLMSPNYDEKNYSCIDLPAMSQVAKTNGLYLAKMKWCER